MDVRLIHSAAEPGADVKRIILFPAGAGKYLGAKENRQLRLYDGAR